MEIVKPYTSERGKKEQVAQMFDSIAKRYDFLNHFLSLGIDKGWRKKAIKELKGQNIKKLLDIATGTGDLAIEASKIKGIDIIGIDISEQMLAIGRKKIKQAGLAQRIELLKGDSEQLQFNNNSFDAITAAFGVRNFENLNKGLTEMYRVLAPGGKVIILEFSKPTTFPFKHLYQFYFKYILPGIGRLVSKDHAAYTYLPQSVQAFPDGELFIKELQKASFTNCRFTKLTFGVASIYIGEKA